MRTNPLKQVEKLGQSIWLDYLSRDLISRGQLKALIDEDGVRGVTSNPKIFDQAIEGSADYDDDIRAESRRGMAIDAIYESLVVNDIRQAADVLRPVYDRSQGADGFVSLEVNPHLAHNTQGTIEEAQRLWGIVDRPNLCIKIPATEEGLDAIGACLREGINVNVTLLFGLPRYRRVAETYVAALEHRAREHKPLNRIASVASFFLSRIDVMVDPMLKAIEKEGGERGKRAGALRGQVAIACARNAYRIFGELFGSPQFENLAVRGARVQRLLWASTGTKDPEASDVKYVEALIGPQTVNTMPLETLEAYRDHGRPEARIEQDVNGARQTLDTLHDLGIDMDAVTQQLEQEGVQKFNQPFDSLMESLKRKHDLICT